MISSLGNAFLFFPNLNSETHTHTLSLFLTCRALVVYWEADDLVTVVFRWVPGEQCWSARVGCGRHMTRRARQPLPHDDGQLGSGTGGAQTVGSNTLVISRIVQPQLVDEQNSRVLSLNPGIRLDRFSILEPAQSRGRVTRTITHKPSRIPPGQGHCLWGLEDDWWSWAEWERRQKKII